MLKNSCFAVFLIPNLLFRRTYPATGSEAIVFLPYDVACQRAFLWRARPLRYRRQNAAGLCRGCTGTDRCPGSLSSAPRTRAVSVSPVPSSPARRKPSAAACPFAVGQKTIVTHHFKMPCRDMADVTLQHLLLADFLAFVLLRTVIVILMHHGPAAVVA
ncbi:Uncharacterised protein [Serratia proteamaculans]|nr:hypothetical protein 176p_00083 [Serratia entomophila]ULG14796.1 hypothetical protein 145p_00113 [Serratia proteamaculans]ULG10844.1 hypothetical protein 210p_00112 [Serratia entomophila]ULG11848.1 hypothetical protein 626p_00032 [Serratia entomophila]ULG12552.1 hypothetical protein Moraki_2p1_00112 [Serratia entomophila]